MRERAYTVRELIEELSKLPPETNVCLDTDGTMCGCYGYSYDSMCGDVVLS